MKDIDYVSLDAVAPDQLMLLLNQDALRAHLIEHPYFDEISIRSWIEDKEKVDAIQGCRVRAVLIDGQLAGWCGIQPDDTGFELAIVISHDFWGVGVKIFKTLILWAAELGHKEVIFHLLESRREYKALARMAKSVRKSKWSGRSFLTYVIEVC